MAMAAPRAIKDTIQDLMRTLAAKNEASDKESPWAILKKCLSKKEAGHVNLKYFKKGVLSISVDSASWLYHLSLQKEDLLVRLRKEWPAVIKEIRFYLGDKG